MPGFKCEFGFVIADSRINCEIPKGYYKVWVPKTDYTSLLGEINGVGGNIGNLSLSSYMQVIGNCDLYRYVNKNLSRPMIDENTMDAFIGCDTPNELSEIKLGKTKDNKTVFTQGKEWKPQRLNLSMMSAQERGNELTSISLLNTSDGSSVPNFQYYPEGTYMNIPPGTKVVVDTESKLILGGSGLGNFYADPVPIPTKKTT